MDTTKAYDAAKTYHDGQWLFFNVDNDAIVQDIEKLLALKRRIKNQT